MKGPPAGFRVKGVRSLTQVGGGEFVSVVKGNKTSKCTICERNLEGGGFYRRTVSVKSPKNPVSASLCPVFAFVLQEREHRAFENSLPN